VIVQQITRADKCLVLRRPLVDRLSIPKTAKSGGANGFVAGSKPTRISEISFTPGAIIFAEIAE